MFYRPQRYAASELFTDIPPKISLDGTDYKLNNISLSGASASANQTVETPFSEGDVLPLAIRQAGIVIHEGKARVVRLERHAFGSRVAIQFVDGTVDFNLLLRRNTQARISDQLDGLELCKHDLISREYRAHCADVLHFLRSYRAIVDTNIQQFSNRSTRSANDEIFSLCEEKIIPQWRKLWLQGNELTVPLLNDKPSLQAAKSYTELVLTPEFAKGPVWWRSYYKPAGYPGDFEIMNYVYDWQREGQDTYAQLLHRIGLDVSECIATRMQVVRRVINETLLARSDARETRILSLGCGSAREVQLHLDDATAADLPVSFTLIDQEEKALAYAYEKSFPLTAHRKRHAKIQALNVSFTDVLRGGKWLDDAGPQDLIYSVGLIDYLVDKRARSLAERLYERLKPGGMLIIGNMNDTPLSNIWPMEFITDWHLFYRTNEDMLAWTTKMANCQAWTETEHTGRVRLLFARKLAQPAA